MRRHNSSDIDWRKPPKDVPPDKLFRLLLRRPRPVLRLDVRLDVAPSVTLFARAITASERAIIRDAEEHDQVSVLLALSIVDIRGCPVFAHHEETHALLDDEADDLGAAVLRAHRVISPSYDICDTKAWHDALCKGAEHPLSFALVSQIRSAFDTHDALKKPIQPRMDRYFGLPLADITDGQRMAFLAAFHTKST